MTHPARGFGPAAPVSDADPSYESLLAAITPSGETKAKYIGEFSFADERRTNGGGKRHIVPWVTVKEIMHTIRRHALERDAVLAYVRKQKNTDDKEIVS